MFKWIKNYIRQSRIVNNKCPYCNNEFESVFIFNGEHNVPSLICPYRHFVMMDEIVYGEKSVTVKTKYIDVGGAAIPIPEEYIKYDYKFEETE